MTDAGSGWTGDATATVLCQGLSGRPPEFDDWRTRCTARPTGEPVITGIEVENVMPKE